MRSRGWIVFGTLLVILTTTIAQAKVGFRQLTCVYPVAVQRGTSATIQVRSNFTLDGAYQVYFDRPGIQMTLAEEKPIEAPLTARGTAGTPFRFQTTVPANQQPGVYEVRIATPQAVSSVTHLLVTDFPVVTETDKENGPRDQAQAITTPVTVCGVVSQAEDVDSYKFAGKKGTRLTFQVYGQRVTAAIHDMVARGGNYHVDPIITLYSPTGQVVAQNDNFFGGDSLLSAELPIDGDYVIEIRDTRYIGDPRYTYAIEISDQPVYRTTFPAMVQQGKSAKVELLAAGYDHVAKAEMVTDNDQALGWNTRRLKLAGQETNAVRYGVSADPQITVDRTKPEEKPIELKLPVGVNGRLATPGEAHEFAFEAKKDGYYQFTLRSQQLGVSLDGVMEMYDAQSKKVADADDSQYSQDPALTFKAPADGRFVLRLKDLHDRGEKDFVYHLEAKQVTQDFELGGRFYYNMIAPGTHMMWFAKLTRSNGFEGPVEVHVDNLPEGVTFTPLTIPAGMVHGAMILSCKPDAKVSSTLARVWGKATITGIDGKPQELIREGAVTCELQNGGGGQGFWPIKTSLVGVVEPMDLLEVEASPSELKLDRGGKVEFTVKIERNKGYEDPVVLEMIHQYFTIKLGEQLPPGVALTADSPNRLSGKTLEAKMTLEAKPDALAVERLPIGVVAGVSISFSINTLYSSNPMYLTISGENPAPGETKPAAKSTKKDKK
jgi:hypothetical protein